MVSRVEKVDEEGGMNGEEGGIELSRKRVSERDRTVSDKWSGENAVRIEGMVWKREIALRRQGLADKGKQGLTW